MRRPCGCRASPTVPPGAVMTTQNHNPFVLPGFGQSADMASNPLMASMEMMRQAWQGLAGSSGLDQASMTTPVSLEDLERRIADLRAVENWLRMSLSMLASPIQGREVPRATIATLKSFMGSAMRSEEHTSELQSLMRISYAVFCLKKKKTQLYDS